MKNPITSINNHLNSSELPHSFCCCHSCLFKFLIILSLSNSLQYGLYSSFEHISTCLKLIGKLTLYCLAALCFHTMGQRYRSVFGGYDVTAYCITL